MVPGTDPLAELARALAATAVRLELGWSASEVRGRLDASSEGLRQMADDLVAAGLGTHQRRQLLASDRQETLPPDWA